MEEIQTAILAIVDANGGRCTFDTVKNGLDYRQQQGMVPALRDLKKRGIAQKQSRMVDGKPVFEVFRIGAPSSRTVVN